MQNFKHIVELDYKPSFRSEKVRGMFDISIDKKLRKEWDINIPIDEKSWNIGLITGLSGSGKTTLSHKIFGDKLHDKFEWTSDCFLDDFPPEIPVKGITEVLSKVGFSSPPSWLLPYKALSNGQKFRAELARCLFEYKDLFVFDEFTSVVDRQVAKIGSYAFQKLIRKENKNFVAVTCHYDVEEWLEPDWVFDVSSNKFKWGSLRRPPFNITIQRVHHSAWKLFKDHHYLDGNINKGAVCFCAFINDIPVAFTSWIPFVGKLRGNQKAKIEHRTVVLPDFQGLGIGNILSNTIASMWLSLNFKVISTSSHPSFIQSRIKSKYWKLTRQKMNGLDKLKLKTSYGRYTCGFEFIGDRMDYKEAVLLRG